MPITKGDKSVVIHRNLVSRLKNHWEDDENIGWVKGYSFQRFINELLDETLDKREFIEKHFPKFHVIHRGQDSITIKDSKQNGYIEVFLRDKELFCQVDKTKDCDHVHYVYALPEVGRLGLKKPPRRLLKREDFNEGIRDTVG